MLLGPACHAVMGACTDNGYAKMVPCKRVIEKLEKPPYHLYARRARIAIMCEMSNYLVSDGGNYVAIREIWWLCDGEQGCF